jgi:hypothetical protein
VGEKMQNKRLQKAVFLFYVLFFLSLIVQVMFCVGDGFALDFTVSGVVVSFSYKEPVTNEDGSALTDLAFCTVLYDLNDGSGSHSGSKVNASSVSGGQVESGSFEIPVSAGQERDVDFWATCTDKSGNESKKSSVVRLRIDRLSPSAPQ